MNEHSEIAETASLGLANRANPTRAKIATGNPSVRMFEVALTVWWMNCSISLTEIPQPIK